MFVLACAISFFITGILLGFFFCYFISYYAILVIILFNIIELYLYAENIFHMSYFNMFGKRKCNSNHDDNNNIDNKIIN